jgi:hypothetical protein
MDMRGARMLGMCGLVIVALGCGKVSKDNSKVLANVGGEKITEKAFGEAIHLLVGDDARAKELLTSQDPTMKEQRKQILAEFVDQKILLKYGEKQGLDKDPKTKFLMEGAKANAYGKILMDRLIAEPTEAQERAFYAEAVEKAKAAGQAEGLPAFEKVQAQIANSLKQKQAQETSERLLKDAKAQVQSTIDPDWRTVAQGQ